MAVAVLTCENFPKNTGLYFDTFVSDTFIYRRSPVYIKPVKKFFLIGFRVLLAYHFPLHNEELEKLTMLLVVSAVLWRLGTTSYS